MPSEQESPAAREPKSLAQTMSLNPVAVETSGLGAAPNAPAPPSGAGAQPVKRIGRFEVHSVLGQGAFGAVYRARDPQLDRWVAIKVPRPGVLKTAEDMHRFLREARAAATLNHPQVCPVYEVGEEGGTPYIVMALVDGKTLADVLKTSKSTSDRQAATAIRKVALALEEAHRKQIIHRDLKPANIMINRRGEPVVMDFGLARLSEPGDVQLTMSGVIMGTPAYMSPEQARGDGRVLGPSTDIYSLGVILYEMLAGRRPFDGTLTEVLASILHVEPELPSKHRREIDLRLEAICMKAMAKSPADRYPSMGAFATALGDYLREAAAKTPDQPSLPPILPPNLSASSLPPLSSYAPSANSRAPTSQTNALPPPVAAPLPLAHPTVVTGIDSTQLPGSFGVVRPTLKSRPRRQKFPSWVIPTAVGLGGLALVLGLIFAARDSGQPPSKAVAPPANQKPSTSQALLESAPAPMRPSVPTPVPSIVNNPPRMSDTGWVDLFNGKDLTGWTPIGTGGWSVRDGVLRAGPGDGWLATTEEFTDFELELEYRIGSGGNSGVFLRAPLTGAVSGMGLLEIQLLDDTAASYANISDRNRTGAAIGLFPAFPRADAPPNAWNRLSVRFVGSQLATVINGRKVSEGNLDDEPRAALPVDLKPSGRIGLQQRMVGEHEFRNIRVKRITSTPPQAADAGWLDLFNGKDLTGWVSTAGGPATWKVVEGAMEIDGPSIKTERKFGSDFELHVEFWIAKGGTGQGQRRGNSGVYLQGRHEIQIMDGYNNPDDPKVSCGALFGVIGPSQNVCKPPEQWQTFDITFHGPRFQAGNSLTNGRITVIHNGAKVIDDVEFPPNAGGMAVDNRVGEPGPIMLQNHGSKVRFRNIRLRELNAAGTSQSAGLPPDVKTFAGHAYKFYPETMTWKQAKARCELLGGHLVVPESIEENQFVGGLIAAADWQDAWIGITDEGQEGQWRDVKGESIAFKNWLQGQPNNKQNEEHFALMTHRTFGNVPSNCRWCDQPNAALSVHQPGFVCEWDR